MYLIYVYGVEADTKGWTETGFFHSEVIIYIDIIINTNYLM